MKVGILAGGYGTRLSEETSARPKPMVEIGGMPILWHIMKIYAAYGCRDFTVALGYKSEVIKDFFLNYRSRAASRITVDLHSGTSEVLHEAPENWRVHLLETGLDTPTGGRVRQLLQFAAGEPLLCTYGDGVADIDIGKLLAFHRAHGKLATITAVRPPARFGGLRFDGDRVVEFVEKPQIGEGWINGGFLVLEPDVLKYFPAQDGAFESTPLEGLVRAGQLMAYRHESFWQCMDTLRDVQLLNNLWNRGQAPWKVWP